MTTLFYQQNNLPHRPIITFFLILLLPSSLAFLTLMIHRIRAHRDAIRDRAPEDVVNSLPTRVWAPPEKPENEESGVAPVHRMWWDEQMECAICLSPFALGETLRVLPCHHIFHVAEVDEWLLHRKKVVSYRSFFYLKSEFI
jgi:E3 ubiquitin-protein ligase RNF13